ncbi:hypothetical protein B0O80DRAFT_421012 [Mortierella sp. GBAus27b]|nr:hypothetical protein B0O80DRAFT_421012 [Mortierella sp. GBAus27b]
MVNVDTMTLEVAITLYTGLVTMGVMLLSKPSHLRRGRQRPGGVLAVLSTTSQLKVIKDFTGMPSYLGVDNTLSQVYRWHCVEKPSSSLFTLFEPMSTFKVQSSRLAASSSSTTQDTQHDCTGPAFRRMIQRGKSVQDNLQSMSAIYCRSEVRCASCSRVGHKRSTHRDCINNPKRKLHQKADGAFDGGGAVVATMPPSTPGHPLPPSPTLETDKSSSSSYHHGGASMISQGCQAILKVGIVFANPGGILVGDSSISNIQQSALHGVLQQYRRGGGVDN